jgi:SLOG family YspA-like protein
MKVLVTGSRDWSAQWVIRERLKEAQPTTVVEGGQTGADRIAREIATADGVDVVTYWANWKRHGKAAGPIRNQKMLLRERPDLVLAFPLPSSRGTWDMVKQAKAAGIQVKAFDQQNQSIELA